ncbi:hypothetical protein BWQ96_06520 [Gracilariopsis chorda]|uniref:Uncharacterized protein n=1 Tax=Gracilariopsis chorda TaxID=448386 RepID=A0A2V3INV7_9FLOR|nr:hypothetical protein BWQ96_06520 [Gracilariopsis chorda]|eukprot:PXF43743.1 hypothetical protein BWQ96_06520 [Gracilariopsis chorda]
MLLNFMVGAAFFENEIVDQRRQVLRLDSAGGVSGTPSHTHSICRSKDF